MLHRNQSSRLTQPTDEPPIFDRALLLAQCGGDEALAEEIVRLFREQMIGASDALPSADPATRIVIAHGLKGAARNCGASWLADKAARLEREPANESRVEDLVSALSRTNAALGETRAAVGGNG